MSIKLVSVELCLLVLVFSQTKADRVSVFKKVMCSYANPLLVKINYCRFEPMASPTISGNFSLDAILLQSQDNIKIQVKEYVKKGKKFEPTMKDFNYNFCDLTSNFNSSQSKMVQALYEKWSPNSLERFSSLLHPCPYSGRIVYTNLVNVARHSGPSAFLFTLGTVKQVANLHFNDQIAFSLVSYKITSTDD